MDSTPEEKPAEPDTEAPRKGFLKFVVGVVQHPAFKVILAAGIIVFLIKMDRFKLEDFQNLTQSWGWVLLGALALAPGFLVGALRFKVLLNGLGLSCGYGRALSWTMIGALFDVVMPSATGGDLIKIVYVVRAYGPGQRGVAGTCVFVDRVVGLLGLMLFGLVVCLVGWSDIAADENIAMVPYLLMAIIGGALVGFLLFSSKRLQESSWRKIITSKLPLGAAIERVYLGFAGVRPGTALAVLGLSFLNHTVLAVALLIFAKSLGIAVDPMKALVVMPFALFMNAFGVFGGVGAGQLAFEYLFSSMLNTAKGVGSSLATVFHVVSALDRVVYGLPFFVFFGGKKALPSEIEARETGPKAPDSPQETESHSY